MLNKFFLFQSFIPVILCIRQRRLHVSGPKTPQIAQMQNAQKQDGHNMSWSHPL